MSYPPFFLLFFRPLHCDQGFGLMVTKIWSICAPFFSMVTILQLGFWGWLWPKILITKVTIEISSTCPPFSLLIVTITPRFWVDCNQKSWWRSQKNVPSTLMALKHFRWFVIIKCTIKCMFLYLVFLLMVICFLAKFSLFVIFFIIILNVSNVFLHLLNYFVFIKFDLVSLVFSFFFLIYISLCCV